MAEIIALLSLSVFLLTAAALLSQARTDAHALAGKTEAAIVDFRRVVLSIGGTAAEIRKTSITTREAALEQRRLLRETTVRAAATLLDADATVRSLNETIQATNENLNGNALPQVTQTIRDFDYKFNLLADDAHAQLGKLGQVQDNLIATSAGLATVVENPDIPKTLANVQASTADLKDTADYYRKKLTTPASFTWHLLKGMLVLGGAAADAAEIKRAVQ